MSWLETRFNAEEREKVASLREEMAGWEKSALPAFLSRAGAPALAGAGVGAFHELVNGTLDAKDEGNSWGDALRQGGSKMLRGAAVGAAAGGAAGMISPALAERTTNFGKGLLHNVTGWKPKGGLKAIGTGSSVERDRLKSLIASDAPAPLIANQQKQLTALEAVEDKNLTNLPGLAKGLLDPRRTVDTLRTSKNYITHGLDGAGKAMLGIGIAGSVLPAVMAEDATPGERARMAARPLAGMLLTSPLQAATSQASTNTALGGMGAIGEGIIHNTFSSGVGRLATLPTDLALTQKSERPYVPKHPTIPQVDPSWAPRAARMVSTDGLQLVPDLMGAA